MKNKKIFKTADLCDDYSDELIIMHQQFRSYGNISSFCGEIHTIKCQDDNSKVREAVNTNGCNKVLVVDGNASIKCALLGDMLAEAACKNNWSGIIVNGCIRDSDVIETIDIGVFALSSIPIKSVKKGLGDTNVSLNFMGITFNPGEYIYADQDGIVISKKELKIN